MHCITLLRLVRSTCPRVFVFENATLSPRKQAHQNGNDSECFKKHLAWSLLQGHISAYLLHFGKTELVLVLSLEANNRFTLTY